MTTLLSNRRRTNLKIHEESSQELPTVILIEDEPHYRDYVTPVIEAADFRVVHCDFHKPRVASPEDDAPACHGTVIADVLIAHPEAIGIVSDVDTDCAKSGVEWAKEYLKTKNPLPLVLTSSLHYCKEAEVLRICAIPKPFVLEDGSGPLTGDGIDQEIAEIAEQFPGKLRAWLAGLKPRQIPCAAPR